MSERSKTKGDAMPAFARVYQSFEDFEREELRKLNSLDVSIDDMFDDWFVEELELDDDMLVGSGRGKKRRVADDDE